MNQTVLRIAKVICEGNVPHPSVLGGTFLVDVCFRTPVAEIPHHKPLPCSRLLGFTHYLFFLKVNIKTGSLLTFHELLLQN